jgi:hypothetical protein
MTGIEPAYSAWEAIFWSRMVFEKACSGRRQRTQMPTAPAFSVRSAHAHGSVPVRLWFGSVWGTHGVSRAHPARRGNPNPYPAMAAGAPRGQFLQGASHTYRNRIGNG